MKSPVTRIPFLAAAALLGPRLPAQTPKPAAPAAAPLRSAVSAGEKITLTATPKSAPRNVFAGPTATVDKRHCLLTTLHPGEKSGKPSKPRQEAVGVMTEGTVQVHWDGQSETGGPGSLIFLAAGAIAFLRNAGPRPAPTS